MLSSLLLMFKIYYGPKSRKVPLLYSCPPNSYCHYTVIQVFSIFCRYLLSLKSLFNAFSYSLPAVNLSTDAVSKQSLQWVISGYQIGQVQSSSPFPLVPLIPLYTTHTPVFKTKSLLFVPEIFLPLCTLQLVYNYKVCPNIALSKNLWQLLRWWQV